MVSDLDRQKLSVEAELTQEQKLREKTNDDRLKILNENRLATGQEDVVGTRKAFRKHWWTFTKEQDGKVPFISRWFYGRMAGTGQPISLGLAISFGPTWGCGVVTLPMIEFTAGYVPSPMSYHE